jgi:TPR repeat protein
MRKLILVLACVIIAGSTIANADDKLVDLVKKVKPSVVLIETFDKDNKPIARGSGFFINNKGSIITNHHVIEGAYSATIKTSAGKVYPVQGIIAKDTEADIVKLVVNLPDANITFLNLSVNVPSEGEDVFVIGNPLGLESTVSSGIVSAVRDIPAFGKILQITAPISHGSSGSPVINNKGQVIGIATLIFTEGQNLNFAIPSDKIIALKETAKATLSESYALLTVDANDAQSFYDKGLKELWQENWSAALTYFQKATEKNSDNADAWFQLGYCYGELGRYQEAIEAYKQAIRIKPDLAEAHLMLGVAYGKLGRYQEAIEAHKQAIRIEPNFAEAHYNLGVTYDKLGRYQEAIEAYKQAIRIKPDNAEAHLMLGVAYYKLDHYQAAIEAFKQAIRIKPDDAPAQCNLGVMYDLGRGVPQDYNEAFKWFTKAAKQGNVDAQFKLGGMYYEGRGVPQDSKEAIKWFTKSAEQGDTAAQFSLGLMYNTGAGVPRDYNEAVKWFTKSAEHGEAAAQYSLGLMYDTGAGVPRDYNEAVKWYTKAAEQGFDKAQNNLGLMYEYGEGVLQDYIEAYKWYNLAAAQGDENAAKEREILIKKMTPSQIAEGQRLSKEFKPKKQ